MDDFNAFMQENDEKYCLEDLFLIMHISHYLLLISKQ